MEALGSSEPSGASGAAQKTLEIAIRNSNAVGKGPRLAFHRTIPPIEFNPQEENRLWPFEKYKLRLRKSGVKRI